jgi:hypothetical protein
MVNFDAYECNQKLVYFQLDHRNKTDQSRLLLLKTPHSQIGEILTRLQG